MNCLFPKCQELQNNSGYVCQGHTATIKNNPSWTTLNAPAHVGQYQQIEDRVPMALGWTRSPYG